MIIWNIEKLALKLKNNEITEKEKFIYFFIYIVLSGFVGYYTIEFASNLQRMIELLITSIITILGLLFCFNINQKGDGKVFIERYICLSLPISIRIIVYGTLLYGLYMIIALFTMSGYYDPTNDLLLDFVYTFLIQLVFYVLLYRWIRVIANNKENKNSQ
ncbi:hypothetical protein [Halalkalibacter akibai]|uniref:Uncharacterized protein n=1 Tax=Halalkalibacter akibai (strain ATCC 43226 / DSM 21942 / CIP 109018 / JCM 9157 / 1139) TaxID=1236973 RepID=W4QU62_HALA3|nr:hypothetical protein [Halalkalibacter akibai]GAE35153.1 hypothetical protein JCM9157_2248 [Halalkalibacter akibai JCM 9157]